MNVFLHSRFSSQLNGRIIDNVIKYNPEINNLQKLLANGKDAANGEILSALKLNHEEIKQFVADNFLPRNYEAQEEFWKLI